MDELDPNLDQRAAAGLERRTFWLLIALAVVLAGIWLTRLGAWGDDRVDVEPGPLPDYANKLDPNTADWVSLARLPRVGERRARDIVAYREQVLLADPDAIAFTQPDDLTAIKGIGEKTADRLAPLLHFPAPTTRPDGRRSAVGP